MSDKPRVEIRPLTDALPDEANLNKHTQKGVKLLENSMRRRGFNRPIAAAGKGVEHPVITAGNLTQETAVNIGMDKEAIFVYSDGTRPIVHVRTDVAPGSAEAIALGLEDNRIGQESLDFDLDLVAQLAAGDSAILSALKREDKIFCGMLEGMGVKDEVQDAEPQIDRAAELQKLWGTELGQLWQIGEHRLVCGDCTDAAVVARVMGGEFAEFVLADAPYNFNPDGGWSHSDKVREDFLERIRPLTDFSPADFLSVINSIAFGSMAVFCGKSLLYEYLYFCEENQYLYNLLVWCKDNPPPLHKNNFLPDLEYLVYVGTEKRTFENGLEYKDYSKWYRSEIHEGKSEGDNLHPTIKPLALVERLIKVNSKKTVLDPFAGSGTTLVACQNLSRRGRAIEISPAYVAVCLQRMADAFPQLEIKRLE